jgi:hypothetical protein
VAWISRRAPAGDRTWAYLKLEATEHVSAERDFKWLSFAAVTEQGERIAVCQHHLVLKSVLAAATVCNQRYVESQQYDLRELEKFLAWQRERIIKWKPAELTPITKEVAA